MDALLPPETQVPQRPRAAHHAGRAQTHRGEQRAVLPGHGRQGHASGEQAAPAQVGQSQEEGLRG